MARRTAKSASADADAPRSSQYTIHQAFAVDDVYYTRANEHEIENLDGAIIKAKLASGAITKNEPASGDEPASEE